MVTDWNTFRNFIVLLLCFFFLVVGTNFNTPYCRISQFVGFVGTNMKVSVVLFCSNSVRRPSWSQWSIIVQWCGNSSSRVVAWPCYWQISASSTSTKTEPNSSVSSPTMLNDRINIFCFPWISGINSKAVHAS